MREKKIYWKRRTAFCQTHARTSLTSHTKTKHARAFTTVGAHPKQKKTKNNEKKASSVAPMDIDLINYTGGGRHRS